MDNSKTVFIRIGRVTRTQGLGGAVRVEPLLEDERVFENGRQVIVMRGAAVENSKIEFSRRQHGRLVVKLHGADSIAEAELLVGAELAILESDLPPAQEGSFYTFHLKGCRVTLAGGEELGRVTGVLDSGATPILQVDGKEGEILIPFAQAFLRKVDLAGRHIEVELPAGLRDLNK